MNKKTKERKERSRRTLLILLFFAFLAAALLLLNAWDKQQGFFPDRGDDWILQDSLTFEGEEYVRNENIETILVTGLDKFSADIDSESYYNDLQADFLMLFVLDNQNKTYHAIHINRDTMVPVNVLGVAGQKIDTVTKQIALAYTYGNGQLVSLRNTADAASTLLGGVKINHSISVTLDAVPILNDAVGGVTVKVIGDFTNVDDAFKEGEEVTLLGDLALRYVRARQGMDDSTNVARMERQRQYLEGLYRQTLAALEKDSSFIASTLPLIAEHMVSNGTTNQLQTLFEKMSDYEFLGIDVPEGQSQKGAEFIEFYPDQDALLALLVKRFYQPA